MLVALVLMGITAPPLAGAAESGRAFHVSPSGDDANPGTVERPLATLAAAQRAVRPHAGREAVTVLLHGGPHYLPETVRFGAGDSGAEGAPVVYAAAPGERPIISGGVRLAPEWEPFADGIWRARLPISSIRNPNSELSLDQIFVNGERQPMARYPNYDPGARQFNGSAADAIAPGRVARWADPAGGYIHAMHKALWGDMHWRIRGKKTDGALDYEGGWQNNRPSPMHPEFRFVENIREELDAPGEWFHDAREGCLYLYPPPGVDLKTATIEAVRLRHLIEFHGTEKEPVRHIILRGLTFRHAARTFMDNREPLLRSDWTTHRGGAVFLEGAEDAAIEDCDFDQVGGNAIFVSRYNRRVAVRGCLIREAGANGVAFVGDPGAVRGALFHYDDKFDYASLDRTPGPIGGNFPADCVVEDCLITRSGRFEKQTAPVQISMARRIAVRHCSLYDVPRAGINIGDGCWGGHLIESCDIFDTVMETGDHGSFNSWGRDRYWSRDVREVDKWVAADPALPCLDMVEPTILRNSRWRCDHGWDIDLDDGSSNYQIYNNLLLHGGLKLREGYGRTATNNIIVNNSLHPHVWFENSGDVFARNIVMGPYRPARMDIARWGKEVNRNLFTTSEADRAKFAGNGCDADSRVGDPMFVDAAEGDFRVKDGSPALGLGFSNFPMDQFGVRPPRLRAMARQPEMPPLRPGAEDAHSAGGEIRWRGATLRELMHYEFSAVGVAADAGGAFVADAPPGSEAFALGLRKGDLIQGVSGKPVRGIKEFAGAINRAGAEGSMELRVIRNQAEMAAVAAWCGDRASADTMWAHVHEASELSDLRAMSAAWRDEGTGRVLSLAVTVPGRTNYAWCTIPAPEGGWDLARREAVVAEIANRGEKPAEMMLWVVGRRGWDAVGDHAILAPGESRRFACRLRETFPDGTPKVDPGQIKQVRVMVLKALNGAALEVRGLAAAGEAPPWRRPVGRLDVPEMEVGPPAPGRRVRYGLPGDEATGIYAALYLPEDWKAGGRYPVIAEYPGNIFFVPTCYSTGRPEQCVIGYGMTKGSGAIWVSLPFVDRAAGTIAEDGWGDADATADFAVRMVEEICRAFGGDADNVVLTGFSRGAIACGYIGLRDDRIAKLWKGFHACQHYDGDGWRGATMPGAMERARRFRGRAIFHTDNSAEAFGALMSESRAEATFVRSGLGAHACAMFLDDRPSTRQLREWYAALVGAGHSAPR